jgi:lysophospholipase L1-like esterase
VGVVGEFFGSIGDSITNGEDDNFTSDNLSASGRVIGIQGYQAGLTDLLDATAGAANHLDFNEGVGGDRSSHAANLRVDSILARHLNMDTALVQLGTNDANGLIPSGIGCTGTSCNGTFKGNMQLLVDKLTAAGVVPVVAIPPPIWPRPDDTSTDPWTSTLNNRIREYMTVIQGGVGEPGLSGIALGPDFFGFFMPSATENYRSLFSDTLHPNGLGYRVMSYLWHNALAPAGSQRPIPFMLRNLKASTGALVQQNLLESGNPYYIDEDVRLLSVPAALQQEGRWIMTANADRNGTAANYLTFTLDRDADVYVAYDANVSATALPDWLKGTSGFVDTPEPELDVVTTTNSSCSTLKLYRKSFASGTVVGLGGNNGSSTGAGGNYVVIVVEKP